MEIRVTNEQGRVPVTVFHIKGDIDANTYEQFQAEARQAIEAGTRFLVLDMKEVPYVSSYGIRAISQVFTWLRDASQDEDQAAISKGVRDGTFQSHHLVIVNPSAHVLKVLTDTGMDMYMGIEGDLKKAVTSF